MVPRASMSVQPVLEVGPDHSHEDLPAEGLDLTFLMFLTFLTFSYL